MSEDHAVRLSDDGPSAWSSLNHSASRSDPFIRGISKDYADYLVENGGFEHVDAAEATPELSLSDVEAVMSGTLSELQAALETGKYDDDLDTLAQYEREHKDRDGAYDRIDRRRDN